MEAYDAAVIGAGAEGLAAAITLARAGLSTVVLERNAEPGGRCQTIEFHPGFRASPYCDEVAEIPREIFWSLGLAKKGASFAHTPTSTALWSDRVVTLSSRDPLSAVSALAREAESLRRAVLAFALTEGYARPPRRRWPVRDEALWPGEDWARLSLTPLLEERIAAPELRAHALATTLCGRSADPALNGTALHLLAPGTGSGMPRGGLGTFTDALVALARDAGATISCGLDVTDIRHDGGRVRGLVLADGTGIAAPVVISTLDLKRTFLSLFKWEELPRGAAQRVKLFRFGGATARLLVALDCLPDRLSRFDGGRGLIAISPNADAPTRAYASWRAGALPETPIVSIRIVSAVDPYLAPSGRATMTVTVGGVPSRFFDGGWTHARRDQLRERVLGAIDDVAPGTSARILGLKLIAPPDIEEGLGCTDGDLAGGEIAADQMLGMRPWQPPSLKVPFTPFRGLYIAGSSTMSGLLATCASGVAAAEAALADRKGLLS